MRPIELYAPLRLAAVVDRHRSAPDPADAQVRNLPAGITEPRVLDLLWHLPNGVVDRRAEPAIAEAVPGSIATLKVRILKHYPPPRGNNRAPYKVRVEDDTGKLDLVFFHAERKFIERQLPVGEERYVVGARRALRREAADVAPRLHRAAGGARRPADARAGLSAHRRAVRQDRAEGDAAGAGALARGAGMAGGDLGAARGWPDCLRGAAAAAQADRRGRRVDRRPAVAAARL